MTARAAVSDGDEGEQESSQQAIHVNIPPRFLWVTGTAVICGTAIGLVRGGRLAGMRFLAENVHRPPTTVQGWYFYNKTKNYKVIFGGLKGAGVESLRLGLAALWWVGVEEGLEKVGWGEARSTGAAFMTANAISVLYRLPWKMTRRMVGLGLLVGCTMDALRWVERELGSRSDRGRKENK